MKLYNVDGYSVSTLAKISHFLVELLGNNKKKELVFTDWLSKRMVCAVLVLSKLMAKSSGAGTKIFFKIFLKTGRSGM